MNRSVRLSKSFVERISQPGRYGDGRGGYGLTLVVSPRAGGGVRKSWVQRLHLDGKPVNIGLGPFPVVGLQAARNDALKNRQKLWQGIDPRPKRTEDTRIPTFSEAADRVIAIHAKTYKNEKTAVWFRQLIRDYCGGIARKRIDRVSGADVLGIVTPVWTEKRATAKKLLERIHLVMQWAMRAGFRVDNPATDLSDSLPRGGDRSTPFAHTPHQDVASTLAAIRAAGHSRQVVLALEFLILTAGRSNEIRGARWDEIDLESRSWTLSPERMKMKYGHRVALSSGALAILKEARELHDGSGLVFSVRRGKQLGDGTLRSLMAGHHGTVHGFRQSFTNWAAESGWPSGHRNWALSHRPKGIDSHYETEDMLEPRRPLMESWSDYLGY